MYLTTVVRFALQTLHMTTVHKLPVCILLRLWISYFFLMRSSNVIRDVMLCKNLHSEIHLASRYLILPWTAHIVVVMKLRWIWLRIAGMHSNCRHRKNGNLIHLASVQVYTPHIWHISAWFMLGRLSLTWFNYVRVRQLIAVGNCPIL